MKKFLAIILVCATLLSMLTVTVSAVGAAASSSVGKTVNVDGIKDASEGWGTDPIAYLDKIYGNSEMAESDARGEVYVTADKEYVYIFFELYKEYNVVFDSATTQTFLKVYFGDAGEEEIGFWGTNPGKTRTNPGAKSWTTGEDKTFSGKAINTTDGSYTLECKLPIPDSVKASMDTSSVDIKVSVAQGLADIGGGYISDTAAAGATESTARNAKDNGITVTLAKNPSVITVNQTPTAADISRGMPVVDGKDTEGYSAMDYTRIDTYSFAHTSAAANPNPSTVRFASDGQYLYVYYVATDTSQFSTKPVLYIYSVFSSEGTTAKQTAVYLNESKSNNFVSGKNQTTGGAQAAVVVGETETIAEIRIAIPETERAAIANNGSSVKIGIWERYSMSGEPNTGDAGMTFNSYWNAGYTLPIPKIAPVTDRTVKQIAGGEVTVNGTVGDEGWAQLPYLRLDTVGFYGTKPDPDNTPTEVYLSTDSSYLYMLIVSDNRAGGDHRQRISLDFGSGNGKFTANYYVNRTRSHAAPSLSDCSASDASDFTANWKGETVYTEAENKTITEFAIPLTAPVKDNLLKGSFDIRIGLLEHPNLGDGGYTAAEGYEWSATAKTTVTLPVKPIADNEVRYIGNQSRINPDNADKRDIRFLAVISDYSGYEELGFNLVLNGQYTATVNSYVVYSAITANDKLIYAENYGGEYFFAYTITGLEKNTTYTFDVTAFTKKADAEAVFGSKYTVTVTVDAEGVVSFS